MQLVEQGRIGLDQHAATPCELVKSVKVLEGFDCCAVPRGSAIREPKSHYGIC